MVFPWASGSGMGRTISTWSLELLLELMHRSVLGLMVILPASRTTLLCKIQVFVTVEPAQPVILMGIHVDPIILRSGTK